MDLFDGHFFSFLWLLLLICFFCILLFFKLDKQFCTQTGGRVLHLG